MTVQTESRCTVCNERHRQTREHGWYALDADGKLHPFTPGPITEQRVTIGGGIRDGFTTAVFGGFYKCERCKALLERTDTDLDDHARDHADTDEALAVAWRLVNEKKGAA